jgi:hypothetical protein
MKAFKLPRKLPDELRKALINENMEMGTTLADNLQGALPAIALDGHIALSTAYMNDCEPLLCFAQQVNGFGNKNDVFLENFYLLGGDRVEICTPDGEICEFHNIYTGKRDFVLGKKDNVFSYISGGLKNIGAVITYPVFPILFGILDLN